MKPYVPWYPTQPWEPEDVPKKPVDSVRRTSVKSERPSDLVLSAIERQGMQDHEDLVRSIFQQESLSGRLDTSKPNYAGAIGPMQVTRPAFDEVKRRGLIPQDYQWENPEHSTEAGVAYLKLALQQHGNDPRKAAAFYYGGPKAIAPDGTIRGSRADPVSGKTVASYTEDVVGRMGRPAEPIPDTSRSLRKLDDPIELWSRVMETDEFQSAGGKEREELRKEFAQTVIGNDPEALKRFEERTAPRGFLRKTKESFKDLIERWKKHDIPALSIMSPASWIAEIDKTQKNFDAIDRGELVPSSTETREGVYAAASPEERAQMRAALGERLVEEVTKAKPVIQKMREFSEAAKAAQMGRPSSSFVDINWSQPGTWSQFSEWLGQTAGGTLPTLAAMVAATLATRNPLAGGAVYAGQVIPEEVGNRAEFSFEEGKSDEDVAKYIGQTAVPSVASGAAQAVAGAYGAPALAAAKHLTKRAIAAGLGKAMVLESGTELAEEAISVGTEKALGEAPMKITRQDVERGIEAAAGGFVAGGAAHATITTPVQMAQLRAQKIRQAAERVRGEATDQQPGQQPAQPDGKQPLDIKTLYPAAPEATDIEKADDASFLQDVVRHFSIENSGASKLNIRVLKPGEAAQEGLTSLTEGVYRGAEGEVLLNPEAITNPRRAVEVLAHEVVGHHGVEAVVAAAGPGFEQRWREILQDTMRVRAKGGYASMEAVAKDYGDAPPLIQAMEVLARMAERGESHNLLTRAASLLRNALRSLGFKIRMSDSDLIDMIVRARRAVREGKNFTNEETRAWHKKLDSGVFSRSEADANRALAERAQKTGWQNIAGKSPAEVLAPRKKTNEQLDKIAKARGLKSIKPEQAIKDPNFVKWFGKSKARESNGLPEVWYRGAKVAPEVLKPGAGRAIFFTKSPSFAEDFAHIMNHEQYLSVLPRAEAEKIEARAEELQKENRHMRRRGAIVRAVEESLESGPNVGAFYLRAENPFRWWKSEDIKKLMSELVEDRGNERVVKSEDLRPWRTAEDIEESLSVGEWALLEHPVIRDAMDRSGFDSFYTNEAGQVNIGVFDSSQVKSAIGNTGEFSTESKSVIRSVRPSEHKESAENRDRKIEDIKKAIDEAYGKGTADRLTKAGILRIESTLESPSEAARKEPTLGLMSESDPRGPGASIFWDSAKPSDAPMLVAHEIGEHYGAVRILGRDRYLQALAELRNSKDPEVEAAKDWVRKLYTDLKETDASFMREVAARLVETLPENHSWLKRMLNAVRVFLYKNLNIGKADPSLMRAIAASAIRKAEKLPRVPQFLSKKLESRRRVWRAENVTFEVANTSPAWNSIPEGDRARVTAAVSRAVVKPIAALFGVTDIELEFTTSGRMGNINPSVVLKSDDATKAQMSRIARAISYVLDQEAAGLISETGKKGAVTVVVPKNVDIPSLYRTLDKKEFGWFTSPREGVLEFIVDDPAKSAPKLEAHFPGSTVTIQARGFALFDRGNVLNALSKHDRETLELLKLQASSMIEIAASPLATENEVGTSAIRSDDLVGPGRRVDVDMRNLFAAGPDAVETVAEMMREMPNVGRVRGESALDTIERAIEHFRANILAIFDAVDPRVRERTRKWYIGANRLARALAEEFDITVSQAAAVIAALSPQRQWDVNVSLARRVIRIWKEEQNTRATEAMVSAALAERAQQSEAGRRAQEALAAAIRDKTLGELTNFVEKAAWVRAFDDSYNPRSYDIIDPDGNVAHVAVDQFGEMLDITWGSNAAIANALKALDGISLDEVLGKGHKVRSFYTNIMFPERDGVGTIDTHAVSVAVLRPVSSDSAEVRNVFGNQASKGKKSPPSSEVVGLKGTYPVFLEAYRRAARDRGVLTREMQSVPWDAIRTVFENKRSLSVAEIDQMWAEERKHNDIRREVARRISTPEWLGSDTGVAEAAPAAADQGNVPGGQRQSGRRSDLASRRSQRRPADGVTVEGWHWSHAAGQTTLYAHTYGRGIRGAEAKRLDGAPERLRRRIYFYTKRADGGEPSKEEGLGPYKYHLTVHDMWQSGVSKDIVIGEPMMDAYGLPLHPKTQWEMALLDAGYRGYVTDGIGVILNEDVPVSPVNALQSLKPTPANGPIDGVLRFGFGWVGKYLTSPAYDYLVRNGAKLVSEKVKHGLVSNYGLSGQYLFRRAERDVNINRILRESKNLLDQLSALSQEELRVAYLWMQEKPDTELEGILMASLPEDSQQVLKQMKQLIHKLGQDAVEAGLLSEDSFRRNEMAYLHRSYEIHLKENPKSELTMKRGAELRGENFRGRGIRHDVKMDAKPGEMFTRWEMIAPDGRVLAVTYRPAGTRGPDGYKATGLWEARFFDEPGKVGLWRDLTKEERIKLGEIEEVRYAFAKTVLGAVRDIENARFLQWVKNEYHSPEAMAEPANTGFLTLKTYGLDEYVEVPTTKIRGTNLFKYGALAGAKIPGVVWNDIRHQMSFPESEVSRAWMIVLKAWKVAKTALSLAVHMNNVMANVFLADLADIRPKDVARAISVLARAKRGDPEAKKLFDLYIDSGAEGGSFVANELRIQFVDKLMNELEKVANTEMGRVTAAHIVSLMASGQIGAGLRGIKAKAAPLAVPFEKMIELYQSEDSVFRLAKFIRDIDAGATVAEAGMAAREAFMDYDINAPWVQAARSSVLPFIAFSYRAFPLIIKGVAKKPWKLAKWYALGSILNAMAYALFEEADEDKERAMLPEELSGRLLGIFPRLIRLPWNDKHGSPVFLDARRWFPGGDMIDLNQSKAAVPIPSWLSVSGPLSIGAELMLNRSSFTGRDIVGRTDSAGEAALKVMDHLFKAFSPNLPLPGPGTLIPSDERGLLQTYSWQSIIDAGTGRTDPFGRDQSLSMAILSSFGVKVKGYPEDVMRANIVRQYQADMRSIEQKIQGMATELRRNGITQEQFDRRLRKEQEKIYKLNDELRKKLGN